MDVHFLLTVRTSYIRWYYDKAAAPFLDQKHRIESENAPYIQPALEQEEPAYIDEWRDAENALDILGRSCISMLAASIRLYFQSLIVKLGVDYKSIPNKAQIKKKGYVCAYLDVIQKYTHIDRSTCPADVDVIDQVMLVRNRHQHPDHISSMKARFHKNDLRKYSSLFFADESEKEILDTITDDIVSAFMLPNVQVSRTALFQAIDEVEKLSDWLRKQPGLGQDS